MGWKFGPFYFKYSKVLKLLTSFDVFGVWIITCMFVYYSVGSIWQLRECK